MMQRKPREFSEGDVEQSIAARFERQVEEYPNRVAVKAADHALTYQDLNNASNRIAHAILAARGDGEEPIALLVEQGLAAVVMLLGVLKAGKFYVPLDPSHPPTRLCTVVRDAQPPLILTDAAHHSLAAEIAQESIQLVDCDRLNSRRVSAENPKLDLSAERTGYLFYTSGSTGRPKGVTQPQRNILHQIMSYTNRLQISADDRLTLLHSHAFSASRLEIFGALLNGAALFPFSVAEAGMSNLTRWLKDEKITLSHWIPSLFRHFVKSLEDEQRFPAMRVIVLGSEPALSSDIALYRKHFAGDCTLVNRYGTTETGNIRWLVVDEHTELSSGLVPVGFAVDGADVFLIDEEGGRLDPGQIGEICVQSRYLSPGYWKQPELTRTVFLPDPQGGENRIYRTGDLGRMRADGCLEHLGRKDSQIKIRGFRIEKREVEELLSQHPEIEEAVVEVEKDDQGDSRLVGYAVPFQGRAVQIDEIRRHLAGTLPGYMVPGTFVFLEALPRTPNGKVDRLALAAIGRRAIASIQGSSAPVDETENKLVAIWAKLLRTTRIGVRDNFFDLGGDSLLAALLMVQIEKTFGRQLLPAAIFGAPTVERLASLLRAKEGDPGLPSIVPIQPHGSCTPFFWIHGDWSNALLPEFLGPDQPLYGLEHQGQDGRAAEYKSVEAIAEHYLRQIRSVQQHGPYFLGGYSFGGVVAFELAQRLRQRRETVSLLVILDSIFPGASTSSSELYERSEAVSSDLPHSGRTISHLQKLAQLGPRDQVAYVLVGIKNRMNAVIGNRIDWIFKSLLCRVYVSLGWVLPPSVRSFYMQGIYRVALQEYSPQPFAGRAVYFRSLGRSRRHVENWKSLMTDGLEVHEVLADHRTVIAREAAAVWAELLKVCIANAQRSVSEASSVWQISHMANDAPSQV
jgi:amino acid adenylation domain-containing protein